jgi:hypothetical protein
MDEAKWETIAKRQGRKSVAGNGGMRARDDQHAADADRCRRADGGARRRSRGARRLAREAMERMAPPRWRGRETMENSMSTEAPTSPQAPENLDDRITELTAITSSILADAERLRDRVAELASNGAKIPDEIAELVDRLHATADEAERDLALADDLDDWTRAA